MLIDFTAIPNGPILVPQAPRNQVHAITHGAMQPMRLDPEAKCLTPLRLEDEERHMYRLTVGFSLFEERCAAMETCPGTRNLYLVHFHELRRAHGHLRHRGDVRVFVVQHRGEITFEAMRQMVDDHYGKNACPVSVLAFYVNRHY